MTGIHPIKKILLSLFNEAFPVYERKLLKNVPKESRINHKQVYAAVN